MAGDEAEVEALLAKGASVDTAAMDGLTALHQVAYARLTVRLGILGGHRGQREHGLLFARQGRQH